MISPSLFCFFFLFHALKTGRQNCCISAFVDSTESSGGNWIKQKNPALTVLCILSNSQLSYPVTENKALGPNRVYWSICSIRYSTVQWSSRLKKEPILWHPDFLLMNINISHYLHQKIPRLFYSYVLKKFFLKPKWKFVEHFLFCTNDFHAPDLEIFHRKSAVSKWVLSLFHPQPTRRNGQLQRLFNGWILPPILELMNHLLEELMNRIPEVPVSSFLLYNLFRFGLKTSHTPEFRQEKIQSLHAILEVCLHKGPCSPWKRCSHKGIFST